MKNIFPKVYWILSEQYSENLIFECSWFLIKPSGNTVTSCVNNCLLRTYGPVYVQSFKTKQKTKSYEFGKLNFFEKISFISK